MGELLQYFEKNFKIAAKSVRFNLKKYLPFFAAVFIIQIFLGLLLFSADSASNDEKKIISSDYSYHVLYSDLNEQQYLYLKQYSNGENGRNSLYKIVEEREAAGFTVMDPHFDLYLFMHGDNPRETYDAFVERFEKYLLGLNDKTGVYSKSVTPLLENNGASVRGGTSTACFLLSALSLFFLTVLYTVRINNYKFEYGIYMAFGADFKKLSENAIFEMLIVTFVTFLPAVTVSLIMNLIIHGSLYFSVWTLLIILLLSLICSVSSVFFPMFVVSKLYPMKHIIAADNSNYVSSPRISFEMLGKKLSRHYEPFSIFRFRKYFLKIISISAAFSAVAAGVFFASSLAKSKENAQYPQFSLTFKAFDYSPELAAQLSELDGVAYTKKTEETVSMDINSHIMFPKGTVSPMSGFVAPSSERYPEYAFASDKVIYSCCDEELFGYLESYDVIGNLNDIYSIENGVIISETLNNSKKLSVKPGDKVYAAIPRGINPNTRVTYDELDYSTGNKLFKLKLDFYNYDYIELTVAAVIKNIPTPDFMPVYMSESTYKSIVYPDYYPEEGEIGYRKVDIFTESGMGRSEIAELENNLKKWASDVGDITVKNRKAYSSSLILGAMELPELFVSIAVLIALLVPVVWLFSQLIFYRKRYPEMDILFALGAAQRDIRLLFTSDSLITALLSALFTAGFSAALFKVIHFVGNYFGAAEGWFSAFKFPALIFISAIILSAGCAVLSVQLSYSVYCRENSENTDIFSQE